MSEAVDGGQAERAYLWPGWKRASDVRESDLDAPYLVAGCSVVHQALWWSGLYVLSCEECSIKITVWTPSGVGSSDLSPAPGAAGGVA